MLDIKKFAERVKKCRDEKGISQAELARKIGVSAATVSSYESTTNPKVPALDKAEALADALGVSLDWLCGKDPCKIKITDFDIETYLRSLVVVLTEASTKLEGTDENKGDAILKFTDRRIYSFMTECNDLLRIYRNGTLSTELYETCIDKIISKFSYYKIAFDKFLDGPEYKEVFEDIWGLLNLFYPGLTPFVHTATIFNGREDIPCVVSQKTIDEFEAFILKESDSNGDNNPT